MVQIVEENFLNFCFKYNMIIDWYVVPKRCQEIMKIKIYYIKTTILRCFQQ